MGDRRVQAFQKELDIRTFGDLMEYYPYKHIDRTKVYTVQEVTDEMPYVQLKGTIINLHMEGEGRKKRLQGILVDQTGEIDLVWFNGFRYYQNFIKPGVEYIVFGKPTRFGYDFNIAHPEIDEAKSASHLTGAFFPVYTITDRMKRSGITNKFLRETMAQVLDKVRNARLPDTMPTYITHRYQMLTHWQSLEAIHFPTDEDLLRRALMRLKAEEIFWVRLRMRYLAAKRQEVIQGLPVVGVGRQFNAFYHHALPFSLTGAQQRVVKEMFADMKSGKQMNRLLQGDVGSGKTIVALLVMLIAIDNGYQCCMMAPTEILATQHAHSLRELLQSMDVTVELLTGYTKAKDRRRITAGLEDGSVNILIGTHAVIEDYVQFKNLGLAVIDEQHRFGVAHRSKLWDKNPNAVPHVLIMSATPIPRTLAMTLYGDLDVSVIDELPPGRTPIVTSHRYDEKKADIYAFIREQLSMGRQAYFVYPLIEESEKSDMKNLEEGFEHLKEAFPEFSVGMVHGKLKPKDKEAAMDRFVSGKDNILVSTTVIEVGVNVPNATIMVIQDANRFGLSQLHQLRGRVGRGAEQSYCILITDYKISEDGRQRMQIMTESTDGFYIAEQDLKLRGQGDMEGTLQSGVGGTLKLADLAKDGRLVQFCINLVEEILNDDPLLKSEKNALLLSNLKHYLEKERDWGLIS